MEQQRKRDTSTITVTSAPITRSRYAIDAMPAAAVNTITNAAMMYMPGRAVEIRKNQVQHVAAGLELITRDHRVGDHDGDGPITRAVAL